MGNVKTRSSKILMLMNAAFLVLLVLSSCEKMELRGFVTSYENVNQRFDQSMEWNHLHSFSEINVAQNDYVVFAMGDSHVGGTENLDRFFDRAIEDSVAAAVLVGDLTTGHENDYLKFASRMPPAENLASFPIAGNHDLYFDGWKQFLSMFGSSTYHFVVHTPEYSDLFICLDSGGGTLGNKQLDWFRQLLETSREDYRHCLVFTHNNLFRLRPTMSTNPFVEENQVLVDLFIRYQVDMVVTGHDHNRDYAVFGNTTHIIMDALLDDNENASYLKISVNEDDIGFKFMKP